MKKRQKMDDAAILAVIANELSQANITTSNEAALRLPLSYYLGRPNGTEIEGRSQLTSTDVADSIEWLMPQIMKSFTQNNEVVTFDPINANDEKQAELESEFVYDVLMKQNNGFVLIHQFVKDALMQRNGLLKVYYEEKEEQQTYTYSGLTDDQLAMIAADQNTELMELETESYIDEMGNPVNQHDVKIVITENCGNICIDPVAPEEWRINLQHNSIDASNARFTCHIVAKTASDLYEEGCSLDIIEDLQRADLIRTSYRFNYQGETTLVPSTLEDDPNKLLEIGECFMFLDVNGDGISERVKITVAGVNPCVKVLSVEEIDSSPWITTTGILMSHKFQGLSIYDRIKTIQDHKTAVIRNWQDNFYLQNNQRTVIVDGEVNIDDLLVSRPGGIIRANSLQSIMPIQTPVMGDAAFSMLNYLDGLRASRTGVSANGTASPQDIGGAIGSIGADRIMTATEELAGLIVRVIAETGIKPLCTKIRDLSVKHIDSVQDFQFRGQWEKVNPSTWPKRTKSTVRIGTGSGDTRSKLMAIQQVQQLQAQIFQMPGQALVNQTKAYAAINDFCKLSGLQGAEKYFVDPSSPEGQQTTQKAQQEQSMNQQKMDQAHMQQMQMEAKLAESALKTAQAQQDNVMVKGQMEILKHQRELDKESLRAQIINLETQLQQAQMVESGHKQIAELQFKYDQLTANVALELTKLEATANKEENENYQANEEMIDEDSRSADDFAG